MGSKKTTKTSTQNTLPDWLTNPYQQATTNAQQLAQQPAISQQTQGAISNAFTNAGTIANGANAASGMLGNLAAGNFGANSGALTGAANGQFLASNPFANGGQPINVSGQLNSTAANGMPTAVSGALSGMATNNALNLDYLGNSRLNATANGDFLTADSNPYIRGVAQQGADEAMARANAQFGAAGRSNGSGLYAQNFAKSIADATNGVYAQNYANERQLQQGAQGTLLSAEQQAREAALARQYGAQGSIFGAENASAENAANRQYGANSAIFGAQNSAQENAASRAAQAYEAERARQQSAAGGLIQTQLSASSQLPSIWNSLLNGNSAALSAGSYGDGAGLNQANQYAGILSQLSNPFGQRNETQTQTQSGLGSILGSLAQLGGAAGSLFSGGGLGAITSATGSNAINSGLNMLGPVGLPVFK